MEKTYVEQRDGGYWIAGTRISLDSVVYEFKSGDAPESIQRSFPLLTLEEVYGAIAYYLGHTEEIDRYLGRSEKEARQLARENREKFAAENPDLYRRLAEAKKTLTK